MFIERALNEFATPTMSEKWMIKKIKDYEKK